MMLYPAMNKLTEYIPNSSYEGINVETMRYRNGEILARQDKEKGVAQDIDMVSGASRKPAKPQNVSDSGSNKK